MTTREGLDHDRVLPVIEHALREDGFDEDVTVDYLRLGERPLRAKLLGRGSGVIAGIDVARWTFRYVDRSTRLEARIADGEPVVDGAVIAVVDGSARAVLSAERVALNFLQRLSGIASLTSRFTRRLHGSRIRVLDTRKTTPLHRELERLGVRVGGGHNHRFNLSDMVLIKENHIRAFGGSDALVHHLRGVATHHAVEVEVDSLAFFDRLLGARVDRIMLDNFAPDEVRTAIGHLREFQRRQQSFAPEIEVSGGINLDNVSDYAIDGVDFVSIGALTHSAPALDMSLEVD